MSQPAPATSPAQRLLAEAKRKRQLSHLAQEQGSSAEPAREPEVAGPIVAAKPSPVNKLIGILKESNKFNKLLKIVQYICVIIAEFNLARLAIYLLKHRKATPDEIKYQFMRFKRIGSSISTVRMALRLGQCLDGFKYFIKQLDQWAKGGKEKRTLSLY